MSLPVPFTTDIRDQLVHAAAEVEPCPGQLVSLHQSLAHRALHLFPDRGPELLPGAAEIIEAARSLGLGEGPLRALFHLSRVPVEAVSDDIVSLQALGHGLLQSRTHLAGVVPPDVVELPHAFILALPAQAAADR